MPCMPFTNKSKATTNEMEAIIISAVVALLLLAGLGIYHPKERSDGEER